MVLHRPAGVCTISFAVTRSAFADRGRENRYVYCKQHRRKGSMYSIVSMIMANS